MYEKRGENEEEYDDDEDDDDEDDDDVHISVLYTFGASFYYRKSGCLHLHYQKGCTYA